MPEWAERTAAAEDALKRRFGLTPVLATEIEFYVQGSEPDREFWRGVDGSVLKYEKERGEGQYEVALPMRSSAAEIITLTGQVKAALGGKADFSARPFPDQPGSGLHVHLHLEDATGANVFHKQDDAMSDPLRFALGGLLATMREYMPVFAPTPASRLRFQPGANAPTTVSWGGNNRTTALRLPDTGTHEKRIEHRVAGADADVAAVIAAVLEGVIYGLENHSEPGPQIFGDASLAMYGLPRLND